MVRNIASCTNLKCCSHPTKSIPPLMQMAGTYLALRRQSIPRWFIVFQCIVCVLMWYMTIFSLSLSAFDGTIKWWIIYFTNWTQTACTVTVSVRVLSTVLIVRRYGYCNEELLGDLSTLPPGFRRLFHAQTVLTEMTLPLATLVTLNYWALVFSSFSSAVTALSSVQVHGVNALLLWTDYLLSAEGVYWKSAVWSILFGTVYQIWNIIFELSGMTNENGEQWIYEATDWSSGWRTPFENNCISTVLLLVISSLAHFVKYLVIRKYVKEMTDRREMEKTVSGALEMQTETLAV